VKRVRARAESKSPPVAIGEKFYLGMDRYQAEPPKDEAAAPLGRLLKAMEEAMNILIDAGPDSIGEIKRELLPEEGGAPAQPPQPGAKPAKNSKDDMVQRTSMDLSFVAAEPRFRRFLNDLISSDKQFYIPKNVIVTNTSTTGPSKAAQNDPNLKDPNAPKGGVVFVVGNEKLKVDARVDIVDFAETK